MTNLSFDGDAGRERQCHEQPSAPGRDLPKLIKSEPSKDRRSSKYVFSVHGHGFMELTKIFNEHPPHRTIVCVPSAFGCGLGCTFCHLTKAGSRTNAPITIEQLQAAINQVPRDETIPLLVSFMGAGEPLLNLHLIRAMVGHHPVTLATSLPTWRGVEALAKLVSVADDNTYWSLSSPMFAAGKGRARWKQFGMPSKT